MNSNTWMASLHGGHSGQFCEHAESTLFEMLEAAVAAGYDTFGVTEHVPRSEERFLYLEELQAGYTVKRLDDDFERYTHSLNRLSHEFADRLMVLRGFEAEVVPSAGYADEMRRYSKRLLLDGTPAFDYFVGSVHYVDELQIDGSAESFLDSVAAFGGLEPLAIRYYETVAEMVETLRPDVVGHLDLIKKRVSRVGLDISILDNERVRKATTIALDAVQAHSAILDLNTAGWRKGLPDPYPSPSLVQQAYEMGIGFCFGDDSHRPAEVGAGVHKAREYLLRLGVNNITTLMRETNRPGSAVFKKVVSLEPGVRTE